MTADGIYQLLKTRFGAKRGNGDWVRIRCPTCTPNDAIKMKRGVNVKSLATNCFICRAPLSLTQLFGTDMIVGASGPIEEPKEHPQAREWPCNSYVPISALPSDHPAVKFLEKDHILDRTDLYIKYKVGFIPYAEAKDIIFEKDDGSCSKLSVGDSLIFPVFQYGKFIGWQCRFVPGTWHGEKMGKMKYLHVFHKGKCLYNFDNASEFSSVVVVEGVKKAWKFPNGVATFGKGLTDTQIQLIQKWKEVIFMFDGEDDTQKKIQELAAVIAKGKRCINIDPRDYGFASPDEMTHEQAQMIVADAWVKAGYELI